MANPAMMSARVNVSHRHAKQLHDIITASITPVGLQSYSKDNTTQHSEPRETSTAAFRCFIKLPDFSLLRGKKQTGREETEDWMGKESGLDSEFIAHSKCSKREWPLKGCTGSRGKAARRSLFSGRQRAPFPTRGGHTEVGMKGSHEQTHPQEECETGEWRPDQDCSSALTSPRHSLSLRFSPSFNRK